MIKNEFTYKQQPIVDTVLAYDCPFTHEMYMLIICNTLYIESMNHHMIILFIIKEGRCMINDIPKINCAHSRIDDHYISFKYIDLETPL